MKKDLGVTLAYLIYAGVVADVGWNKLEHELLKTSNLFYFLNQQGIGVEQVVSALTAGRNEKNCLL